MEKAVRSIIRDIESKQKVANDPTEVANRILCDVELKNKVDEILPVKNYGEGLAHLLSRASGELSEVVKSMQDRLDSINVEWD